MPTTLATCQVYGTIFDAFGDPAAAVGVGVMAVYKNGALIYARTKEVASDLAGYFTLELPRLSAVVLYADVSGLNISDTGTLINVPDADLAELTGLISTEPFVVAPPLIFSGNMLSIPKASATEDGYLSAADYLAFLSGVEMGVLSFNARTGEVVLLDTDVAAALGYVPIGRTIPGVAGTWSSPTSIVVNNKGQIISITPGGPPDTTAPDITIDAPTAIGATAATINWRTNEPADSLVEYGETTSYGSSSPLDTEPVTEHAVTIGPLIASRTYHYRVTSADTAGNPSTSADQTFATTAAPDTTAPVITLQAPTGISDVAATIHWTTDDMSDSMVEYGETTAYANGATPITNPVPPGTQAHAVAIGPLLPSRTYHYRVTSKNAIPLSTTSIDSSFVTAAAPDTTAPLITLGAPTGITSSGATIHWTTDELADSSVEYGTAAGVYGTPTPITNPVPPGTTAHAVTIGPLAAGTTYYYRVISKDAGGYSRTSVEDSFITSPSSGAGSLMTGLISYWKMDESSGTRFDSHGPNDFEPITGLDGIPVGSATGRGGLCVDLPRIQSYGDGGSYLEAPDDPSQRMTGDFAVVSWFYAQGIEFYSNLPSTLSMWVAGNLGYCLLFNGLSWQWQFSVSGDGATQTDCTIDGPARTKGVKTVDPLSGWHFLCAQYEAATGTMSLSLDAGPVTTQYAGFTGQIFQSTAPLHIGAFDVYRRTWALHDEVGLYGRLLTPSEVALLAGGTVSYPFS